MKKLCLLGFLIFVCGLLSAETIISANITSSQTWNLEGSPYIISGTRSIGGPSNPVVSVDPGVVIKFNAGASLQVGMSTTSVGGLVVNGSSDNPVLITANSSEPVPGFWACIRCTANASQVLLNYAVLEYGGSGNGIFETAGGSPVLDHCTFRNSATCGIYSSAAGVGPTVSNCLFESNTTYPIQTNSTRADLLGSGNLFYSNGIQRILLNSDTLNEGASWLNHGIPYELDDNQYLYTNSSPLVLSEGVELLFRLGKKLYVGYSSSSGITGCIRANTVSFGAVNPASGWGGIEVQPYNSASVFENCQVMDVSSAGTAAFYIRGNNMTEVSGCTIQNCNTYGLYGATGAVFSWSGNTITGCSKAVYLQANDIRKLGAGNQYTFNTDNWIFCPTGVISVTCTWIPQSVPIRVGGNLSIYVSGLCTLTLPPGVVMEFNPAVRLTIGYSGSTASSGALVATGAIFRGAVSGPGSWDGLYFSTYTGSNLLSACQISDAGAGGMGAVTIANNSTTVTGCLIQNNLSRGINISTGKHANISANVITACGSYPLAVDAKGAHYVQANNIMTGNAMDMVELNPVVVDIDCTWRNPGIPYLLTGSVNIYASTAPRLTILPGTIVMMNNQEGILIGYSGSNVNSGALRATGVTFTRSSSVAVPFGLIFQNYMDDANTILTDCVIEYCRNGTYSTAAWCNNSSPAFNACTFRNNPGHGVGGGTSSHFRVENCSFQNNGGYPIKTTAEAFSFVSGSKNSFSGNNPDRILISGGVLSNSSTWNNPGIPVEVNSPIYVYGNPYPILTINSGLHMLFQTGTHLSVGYSGSTVNQGGLHATGAYFSALNNTAGGWSGINFLIYLVPGSYLRYCTIENGGANGSVYVLNSPLAEIFDCVIRNSTVGIKLNGANSCPNIWRNHIYGNETGISCVSSSNPLIGGSLGNANSFTDNTGVGVSNSTASITINAEYNWWGDASGPNGPLGDGVSNYVDYDPYRDSPIGAAPGLFALLSPANGVVLSTLSPLLDWEDAVDPTPGDVVTYTLELNISPSFSTGGWAFSGIPASIFSVPPGNLADDSRYYWRVTAYDSQGQNTFCSQPYLYFDVAVPEAPAAFSLLSPLQDANLPYTSNLLTWQAALDPDPGDTVTYNVLVDISAGFENASGLGATAPQVYSDFCVPGTLYYWQVVASDTQGHSTLSEIKCFYVLPDALPRTPSWLNASVNGSDLILSWEAIPGADSYLLYSADDPYGSFGSPVSCPTAGYNDTGGAVSARKFYQVKAVDSF